MNSNNRIIKQDKKALLCDVLKVPHHGSKNSLSEKILNCMNPKVAVVSHNNRLFGGAKDPHPNIEVINLLQQKKVHVYYTNDVVKNGQILVKEYRGSIKGFDIEIV